MCGLGDAIGDLIEMEYIGSETGDDETTILEYRVWFAQEKEKE